MKKLSLNLVIILFFSSILSVNAFAAGDRGNGNGNGQGSGNGQNSDSHSLNIGVVTHASVGIAGGNTTLDFDMVAPANPGEKIKVVQDGDSKLWLNYSSIVSSGASNKITASLDQDIEGLKIKVNVAADAAGKVGHAGTGLSTKTLSTGNGEDVVNDIKSCYTGKGEGKGHALVYSIEIDDSQYDKLVASSPVVEVTYTITEN